MTPIIAAIVIPLDLARGNRRLPLLRIHLFVCQYLLNDSLEILAAGPLWVAAGFGSRLDQRASQRRHQWIQAWSIRVLARRAEQLLGVKIELDPVDEAALAPGPAIALCRHVSLLDALIPPVLYLRVGIHTRGVIMAELLADPGFDLLYQRAGSTFVPRDSCPSARAKAAVAARSLDDRSVAVIFPEGRLFRPDRLQHALTHIADRSPERVARLAGLRHVLPPRPAGVLALLDAAPTADLVIMSHVGLEGLSSIKELLRGVPLDTAVRVAAWRVTRDQIPDTDEGRIAWLDRTWCEVDRWLDERINA
jgi:1-acyl-sn-glycerol-3-phosphate acyltransferase